MITKFLLAGVVASLSVVSGIGAIPAEAGQVAMGAKKAGADPVPPVALTGRPIKNETPFSYNVSDDGQFSVSVPIDLPPGLGEHTPAASLNFSGFGAEGVLGVGGSLGAGSSIMRCPSTILLNGVRRPIKMDSRDNFCLDGQMITKTASGPAFDEYKSKTEGVTRIRHYKTSPEYVEVDLRNGNRNYYDEADQLQSIAPNGGTFVHGWHLSREVDRFGNEIAYHYDFVKTTDHDYGSRLNHISYGANSRNGVAPRGRIDFGYISRVAPKTSYRHGVRHVEKNLLKNVVVSWDGVAMKKYDVTYRAGNLSQYETRTVVETVTKCETVKPHTAPTECMKSIEFEWEGLATGKAPLVKSAVNGLLVSNWVPGGRGQAEARSRIMHDFDNDGMMDILRMVPNYDTGSAQTWDQWFPYAPFVFGEPAPDMPFQMSFGKLVGQSLIRSLALGSSFKNTFHLYPGLSNPKQVAGVQHDAFLHDALLTDLPIKNPSAGVWESGPYSVGEHSQRPGHPLLENGYLQLGVDTTGNGVADKALERAKIEVALLVNRTNFFRYGGAWFSFNGGVNSP